MRARVGVSMYHAIQPKLARAHLLHGATVVQGQRQVSELDRRMTDYDALGSWMTDVNFSQDCIAIVG